MRWSSSTGLRFVVKGKREGRMEELSFKPITKGLGFHKNKLKIDEEALRDIHWKKDVELPEIDFDDSTDDMKLDSTTDSWMDDSSLGQTVTSYRKPKIDLIDGEFNIDKVRQELEQKAMLSKTLPRNDVKDFTPETVTVKVKNKSKQKEILNNNREEIREFEKRVEESIASDHVTAQIEEVETKVSGNWFASLIDFVVVFGLVNLFMSSLLFVTKLDVFQIVTKTYKDPMTQISLGLIFLGSCFLYTVISRAFFGMTLGDWALDMQLGSEIQRKSVYYPIRVSLRFFLNLFTGFVLLPFLSVLFRKDIAGAITGLSLYRLKD